MTPQIFKRPLAASGTRVLDTASVVGHAFVFAPPAVVVWCFTIGSFIMAPLVVKQAETALEEAAWAAGRILSTGLALSHVFDGATRHDRIVADDIGDALPPRPRAPIIIVPRPDISAPPLTPKRGGKPPEVKPKRKHRAVRQPDASIVPPGQHPDALMPAPVPHREPEGEAP